VLNEGAIGSEGNGAVVRVGAEESGGKFGEGRLARRPDIGSEAFGPGAERCRAEPAQDDRQRSQVKRAVVEAARDRESG